MPRPELNDARFRHDREVAARQPLGGRANIKTFLGLEEIEDVTVRAAAETMEPLFIGIDRERGRPLHMEGAKADQRCAAALQREMTAHLVGQRELVLDRVNVDAAGFNTTRHGGQDHFLNGRWEWDPARGPLGDGWGMPGHLSSPALVIRTPARRPSRYQPRAAAYAVAAAEVWPE